MKILVTGGAGYLGSVLIPKLLSRGHQIRIVDVGYFGTQHVVAAGGRVEVIRDDLRRTLDDPSYAMGVIDGMEAVIHLAAISNDPSAELNPELTNDVNYNATVAMAKAARDQGIRFVFSSSCSVYGEAQGLLDESAPLGPLTTYAVSKAKAEEALNGLVTDAWRPVILRNGTVYGFSPRMRFDLVVNIFSLYTALYNEVRIFGPGSQWRPFLHVRDCARALVHFTELPNPRYVTYNIAHENLRVLDLVEVFRLISPILSVLHVAGTGNDNRDYRVDTERMAEEGFVTRVDVQQGAEEMVEAIHGGLIPDPESIYYRNAKWLKELTSLGGNNHSQLVDLLDVMSRLRPVSR